MQEKCHHDNAILAIYIYFIYVSIFIGLTVIILTKNTRYLNFNRDR